MPDSLWPHGLYSPWHSPGQNTAEVSLSLLQGIFPTQGSKPGLPHWRWILYQLSHKGSPRILEWVAYPFSRGSSQPRNWTGVSCIAGGFFTNWAIREARSPLVTDKCTHSSTFSEGSLPFLLEDWFPSENTGSPTALSNSIYFFFSHSLLVSFTCQQFPWHLPLTSLKGSASDPYRLLPTSCSRRL